MIYGYCRVSTEGQENGNQEKAIYEYGGKTGLKINSIINETISSRIKDRKIYQVIESLKAGDILIVYELSRLARSMRELNQIVNDIIKKSAELRVINNNLVFSKDKEDIQAETMLFAFGLAAKIEKDLISERTKTALKARKAQGVILGRPKGSKLAGREKEIKEMQADGIPLKRIAKNLGCTYLTLYNFLKSKKGKNTVKRG